MKDHIDFEVNRVGYQVAEYADGWSWVNDFMEQGESHESPLEAQQAAITWESERDERHRAARWDREDARWQEQHNRSLVRPV